MATLIIAAGMSATYGNMTNQSVAKLISLQTALERLHDAIATASAEYAGVPGTEFELGGGPGGQNLFGVQPSATPGEQGSAYAYATGRLHEEWVKFWALAAPFIEQLDNGYGSV